MMISKLKYRWNAYLLVLVPLALVLLFNYYPILNGIVHIFYRWNGDNIEEFIGLGNIQTLLRDTDLFWCFAVVGIFVLANLVKMIPAIVTAVVLHRIVSSKFQYVYRIFFVIPMIIPAVVYILLWKYFYEPNAGFLNSMLRLAGFIQPTETVQWLTNKWLVLPSLIFYGFPWVGAFGVLIYLAGLQNIGQDVYEAAKLDGAGPVRIFWNIELPLITTQIRINLIMTIIGTIRGWESIYLFLGESGGPGGIATVPGLYIFREAFGKGYFGYGCAIGFLIFIITLLLTWINNKLVKVER